MLIQLKHWGWSGEKVMLKTWMTMALALGGFPLAACQSLEETSTHLRSAWIGKPTDSFFLSAGPPSAQIRLNNGDTLYTWSSGVSSVPVPGFATTTGNVIGNSVFLTTTSTPSSQIDLECRAQIVARGGVIKDIRAAVDTIGLWQLSRCDEVLKLQ